MTQPQWMREIQDRFDMLNGIGGTETAKRICVAYGNDPTGAPESIVRGAGLHIAQSFLTMDATLLLSQARFLHAALAELVELHDTKPDDYEKRKPLAWERARKLTQGEPTK